MKDTNYTTLERLEDAYLAAALGNMMIAWAHAEFVLCKAMALVCGMNANMALFGYYRIPTFEARVKFIRSMIDEWKTVVDKAAFDDAIERLARLSKTRNDWVHGSWVRGNKTGAAAIFDYRAAEGKGRFKPVKAHDVQDHIKTVLQRAMVLDELIPWNDIAP